MIHKGSEDVTGAHASVICRYGINGGIGSPSETADLPQAGGNNYLKFRAELCNIYGTIEISDKAIRAASSSEALVNLLNAEMEGLLEAAKFNFARMLFQSGDGILCRVGDMTEPDLPEDFIKIDSAKNLIEGMLIDILEPSGMEKKLSGARIAAVDRANRHLKLAQTLDGADISQGDIITVQDSYDSEIFGLPYVFDTDNPTLYGILRSNNHYLFPTKKEAQTLTNDIIQEALDTVEEASGNNANLIICSYDARRAYFNHLAQSRLNVDYMNLDGGFKALSYNGIPVVADRFAPDKTMYFVNTDDFKLMQLGDWSWLEGGSGKILRQMENKAAYTATLVKYANLICAKPIGQGMIRLA
jgi:hypothetical protein